MKTNVSIKFNSIEEYREIESKLIELGYKSVKEWNEEVIGRYKLKTSTHCMFLTIYESMDFEIYSHRPVECKAYDSLQEFLND